MSDYEYIQSDYEYIQLEYYCCPRCYYSLFRVRRSPERYTCTNCDWEGNVFALAVRDD
jgi:ribosomal protein L37AE/L43A